MVILSTISTLHWGPLYGLIKLAINMKRGPRWGIWEMGDWAKKVEDLGNCAKIKWEMGDLDPKWEPEQGNCENMQEHLFGSREIDRK